MSVLIKNGRIWDGESFFLADILTEKDKIAEISPDIREKADFVFDAEGMTVSPGLVDAHAHFKGVSSDSFGISADLSTLPFGVTAASDASMVQGDRALTDGFAVKNVGFVVADTEGNRGKFDKTLQMLEKYGEKAVGIKLYYDITGSDVRDAESLAQTVEFAEKHGLRVMVHSSNSPISMPELLSWLRPGDILTHAYHGGKNNTSEDGYNCITEAKKRGVIIDAGLAGHIHTDFAVFKGAIECGALPDIISTDITSLSAYKRGGRYGLPMCMSIARTLGISEEDIFRAVTSNPASALGKADEWGVLKVGGVADIAVLKWTDEPFELTDRFGNQVKSAEGYRNMLTVSNGEIVYRN